MFLQNVGIYQWVHGAKIQKNIINIILTTVKTSILMLYIVYITFNAAKQFNPCSHHFSWWSVKLLLSCDLLVLPLLVTHVPSMATNRSIVHPTHDTWVNMEQQWNDTDGKTKGLSPSVSFSTTNRTWTALGGSPGLHSEKPVTTTWAVAHATPWLTILISALKVWLKKKNVTGNNVTAKWLTVWCMRNMSWQMFLLWTQK
jgi:hypothetical protein